MKKRLIIDTFDILKTLVENNKLQTLREVVMVANRQYEKTGNMCNIENAIFRYTLEPNSSSSYFDVHYEISLTINKCNKNNSIIKFYAILDTTGKNYNKDIPVLISITWNNGQSSVVFETLPKSVTISGLAHISYCSGLYEISFQIPQNCMKSIKTMPIECKISYCIQDTVLLKDENGYQEYNFVIVPANYGKQMNTCNVEVIVPKALNSNVACQSIYANKEAEKMMDFEQADRGNSAQKCYRPSKY